MTEVTAGNFAALNIDVVIRRATEEKESVERTLHDTLQRLCRVAPRIAEQVEALQSPRNQDARRC